MILLLLLQWGPSMVSHSIDCVKLTRPMWSQGSITLIPWPERCLEVCLIKRLNYCLVTLHPLDRVVLILELFKGHDFGFRVDLVQVWKHVVTLRWLLAVLGCIWLQPVVLAWAVPVWHVRSEGLCIVNLLCLIGLIHCLTDALWTSLASRRRSLSWAWASSRWSAPLAWLLLFKALRSYCD